MSDMFLARRRRNRARAELGRGKSIMMNAAVKPVEKGGKRGGKNDWLVCYRSVWRGLRNGK